MSSALDGFGTNNLTHAVHDLYFVQQPRSRPGTEACDTLVASTLTRLS